MKKIVLTAAALLVTAGTALAVPLATTTPGKIQNSKHDMNVQFNGGNGEICIYCHTPHNAGIAVPLWNRNNPSASLFSLYNSPTLTSNAKAAGLTDSSISLFCMSCHDGYTGLGSVKNVNNVSANSYGITAFTGAKLDAPVIPSNTVENARLGRDLTTTHPIGFNFDNLPTNDTGIFDAATIKATFESKKRPGATSAQDFLYKRTEATGNFFECASCHRVHDPGTSGNFLRIENQQSQLCLACHNK